jgi:hypothetical protein
MTDRTVKHRFLKLPDRASVVIGRSTLRICADAGL